MTTFPPCNIKKNGHYCRHVRRRRQPTKQRQGFAIYFLLCFFGIIITTMNDSDMMDKIMILKNIPMASAKQFSTTTANNNIHMKYNGIGLVTTATNRATTKLSIPTLTLSSSLSATSTTFITKKQRLPAAFVGGGASSFFNKIQNDFAALTRRVTAYHIMVSNEEIAMALKQKIRQECIDKDRYIVNVFEQAAKKYSQDDTTNQKGGLLGILVPQGYCQSKILDRECFQVELGIVHGPIQSEFGHHLLLVTERTNCPKLDGIQTKLIQTSDQDIFGTLVPSKQVGRVNISEFVMNQIGFWILVFLAGGIVAELAEKIVTML